MAFAPVPRGLHSVCAFVSLHMPFPAALLAKALPLGRFCAFGGMAPTLSCPKLAPPEPAALPSSQESQSPKTGADRRTVRKSFLKGPKASDLKPQVLARAAKRERPQREAPIQVQIRKYTNNASIFVPAFPAEQM